MKGKRSFTEVKNSFQDGKAFDEFCGRLAEEYANTGYEFARSYFCNKEQISPSCYYQCLYRAITNNLVIDSTVQRMELKATENETRHAGFFTKRTQRKYYALKKERVDFLLQYSNKEIKQMIHFYATTDVTMQEFEYIYAVSHVLREKLFYRGLIITSKQDFMKVKHKDISNNIKHSKKFQNYFQHIEIIREKGKTN